MTKFLDSGKGKGRCGDGSLRDLRDGSQKGSGKSFDAKGAKRGAKFREGRLEPFPCGCSSAGKRL
jgi:hypothetical protein